MVTNGKIADYRERFDETLASKDLTDEDKLKTLVKEHMLRSSYGKTTDCNDTCIEQRTMEVSNVLEMLRSASEKYIMSPQDNRHASWKVCVLPGKQPYIHDVAKTLQKIRIGEQLSLVRMKLSWPLSDREAVFHYFEFEYFEGDLLVVFLNTPDPDNIQMETHGFTNEGIPTADGAVRMDVVGGLALQKVTENKSYFRTIANLDVKLNFVPPSLINFISRQLIGSGFRFYKKTVASVSNGDEDFSKVLNGPLYTRIRQAVCTSNNSDRSLRKRFSDGEHKTVADNIFRKEEMKVVGNDHAYKFSEIKNPISTEIQKVDINESNGRLSGSLLQCKSAIEIEGEEMNRSENGICEEDARTDCGLGNQPQLVGIHKNMPVPISPQVVKALGSLDKMISVVRENKLKHQNCSQSGPKIGGGESISTIGELVELVHKQEASMQEFVGCGVIADGLSTGNSNLHHLEVPSYVNPDLNQEIGNWSKTTRSPGNCGVIFSPLNMEANGIHEINRKTRQQKKWRLCCFDVVHEKLV